MVDLLHFEATYDRHLPIIGGHGVQLDNGRASSHACLFWVVPRCDCQTAHGFFLTDFTELATESEKWNVKPRLACGNVRFLSSETPVASVLGLLESREMTEQGRLAGKAITTSGLRFGRSEALIKELETRCLRAHSQGHQHTIHRLLGEKHRN